MVFPLRVDPKAVVNRGGEVFHRDGIVPGLAADRVGRAIDLTSLDACTGQQNRENLWPMVTPGVRVDFRSPAEFARHNHQRGLQQSPLVKVFHQCCEGRVELRQQDLLATIEVVGVRVPDCPGRIDGHEACAALHQPSGQQAALADGGAAVPVAQGLGLIRDVECGLDRGRADDALGLLEELLAIREQPLSVPLLKPGIESLDQPSPILDFAPVHVQRDLDIIDPEVGRAGVAAYPERRIRTAKKARP